MFLLRVHQKKTNMSFKTVFCLIKLQHACYTGHNIETLYFPSNVPQLRKRKNLYRSYTEFMSIAANFWTTVITCKKDFKSSLQLSSVRIPNNVGNPPTPKLWKVFQLEEERKTFIL